MAIAAPAAAVDDPSRPDARVTHGPSCQPGGLVVEVVAGTAPYAVRLATTRTPSGEDEAVLQPGETVVLRTGDVDWGETIDGRLEYAARDGSGVAYIDELEEYSFTRPTLEDCEAAVAPSDPEPTPPTTDAPAPSPTTAGDPAPPAGSTSTAPAPPTGAEPSGPAGAEPAPAREVAAGETVTLQAGGFLPGEWVLIALRGSDDVLASAVAGPDGTVSTEIRLPEGLSAGAATVDLVGDESAVLADVHLLVAGAESAVADSGAGDLVPLTSAAAALVLAVAGLVSVAGRARTSGRRRHAVLPGA
ncbi:MAG TPA: hypothetical protein VK402_21770 [Blastococcus sp.]|nr:hypothetical protein [Blastococcus sp.]